MNEFNNELSDNLNDTVSKQFAKIWDCSNIDRREIKYFPNLSAEKEKLVRKELMNFFLYYYKNQNIIDKYLYDNMYLSKKEKIKEYTIINYWFKEIAKPEEIAVLLDMELYSYAANFLKASSKFAQKVCSFSKILMVCPKNTYRTLNSKKEIVRIRRYGNEKQRFLVREFFNKENLDEDHISEAKAQELFKLIR